MNFLTNIHKDEAQKYAAELRSYMPKRIYVIGNPQASEKWSVEQLSYMGLVGIYYVDPPKQEVPNDPR